MISNYVLRSGVLIGPGSLVERWQWQPIAYGTGAAHDPSSVILLEYQAAVIGVLTLRTLMGMGL